MGFGAIAAGLLEENGAEEGREERAVRGAGVGYREEQVGKEEEEKDDLRNTQINSIRR